MGGVRLWEVVDTEFGRDLRLVSTYGRCPLVGVQLYDIFQNDVCVYTVCMYKYVCISMYVCVCVCVYVCIPIPIFCCFLCLLCQFGAIPAYICG